MQGEGRQQAASRTKEHARAGGHLNTEIAGWDEGVTINRLPPTMGAVPWRAPLWYCRPAPFGKSEGAARQVRQLQLRLPLETKHRKVLWRPGARRPPHRCRRRRRPCGCNAHSAHPNPSSQDCASLIQPPTGWPAGLTIQRLCGGRLQCSEGMLPVAVEVGGCGRVAAGPVCVGSVGAVFAPFISCSG